MKYLIFLLLAACGGTGVSTPHDPPPPPPPPPAGHATCGPTPVYPAVLRVCNAASSIAPITALTLYYSGFPVAIPTDPVFPGESVSYSISYVPAILLVTFGDGWVEWVYDLSLPDSVLSTHE